MFLKKNIILRGMQILLLVGLVLVGLLSWSAMRLNTEAHWRGFEETTGEAARLLSELVTAALVVNEGPRLTAQLAGLVNDHGLRYLELRDAEGELLYRSGELPAGEGVQSRDMELQQDGRYLGQLSLGYDRRPVQQRITQTRTMQIVISLLLLLAAMVLVSLFFLPVARRMGALQQGALELKVGHWSHRIPDRALDELDHLASTYNLLAERLEKSDASLVQERMQRQLAQRHQNTLYEHLNALSYVASAANMDFHTVSGDVEGLLGFTRDDWLKPGFWSRRVRPQDRSRVWGGLATLTAEGGSVSLEYQVLHHSGSLVWVRQIAVVEADHEGVRRNQGLLLNIDAEKRAVEQTRFFADHDLLTGLYNRRHLKEELDRQIAMVLRYKRHGALLFIDIDQFKVINDNYGHGAGDQFLVGVVKRISASLRRTDVMARLGGDEFGVILPETTAEHALKVAAGILRLLNGKEIEYAGLRSRITASIGLAMFPEHGEEAEEIISNADAAMYRAKQSGRNRYQLFQEENLRSKEVEERLYWDRELRSALEQQRFELHLQPVVELASGHVMHHKGLLRLRDENGRLKLPAAFMESAQHVGLTPLLDQWVLQKALSLIRETQSEENPLRIVVCLSATELHDESYLDTLLEILLKAEGLQEQLILELPESALQADFVLAQRFIRSLHALGCHFSLRGFGINPGSIMVMRQFPLDFVCIDGSLIHDLDQDLQIRFTSRHCAILPNKMVYRPWLKPWNRRRYTKSCWIWGSGWVRGITSHSRVPAHIIWWSWNPYPPTPVIGIDRELRYRLPGTSGMSGFPCDSQM